MTGIFYLFLVFSILGWCMEVIYAFVKKRHFVNRGFLHSPLCPIYGSSVALIYMVIRPFITVSGSAFEISDVFIVFALIFFVTSVMEYLTGYVLEKLFHTRWWDYSDRKFNIKGYVCMSFSLIWGIGGTTLVFILKYFLGTIDVDTIVNETTIKISYGLIAFLITDMSFTVRSMVDFRSLILEIEKTSPFVGEIKTIIDTLKPRFGNYMRVIEFKNRLEERMQLNPVYGFKNTLESKVRNYQGSLNRLTKNRLYKAFPDMKINMKDFEKRFKSYMHNRKES
jgi:uncharacterized membrane protein